MQWNCNGFQSKENFVKLLIQNFKPLVFAFQETNLKPSIVIRGFKNFNFYRKDFIRSDGGKACKGVMLMIHKCVYSVPVPLITDHNAVAAKVKIPYYRHDVTICSIYVAPDQFITESDFNDIISQLPKPYLLCGDFNAKSPTWGASGTLLNANGRETERFLDNHHDASLLNNGEDTHLSFSYRTWSAIDLSLVSTFIVPDVTWSVHDDLYSSDHLPIFIRISTDVPHSQHGPREIWLFKRANWTKYQDSIKFDINTDNITDIDHTMSVINKNILSAAKSAIPLYNISAAKKYVPWWNDDIKLALQEKKRALRVFKRNSTPMNFISFKKWRAKARRLILESKEKSWCSFVDSIDKPINQSEMWAQIRRVKGKKPYNPTTALRNAQNQIVTDKKELTEILAVNYVQNSSDTVYCDEFINYKRSNECLLQCPPNTEHEDYNKPFSMEELTATFASCRSSAAGLDGICYKMIINLPLSATSKLLDVFNFIWTEGVFPQCWKTAIIVPILKPNKNSLCPTSYRPVSLLSCVNKIFEKIVSKRLKWIIEDKKMIDYYQSGNRKRRSTMDNLLILEHEITNALHSREYLVAIFLDINKFFDRVSKITVLEKLIKHNIGGPMYKYVENFLSTPQIVVKIDGVLSNVFSLDNSVRQGSSMSGDLSNVATSDISEFIPRSVMYGMFVDDLVVYVRSSSMIEIQRQLQMTLDGLTRWSKSNGFTFSPEKTYGMIFTRKRNRDNPRLNFQGHEIIFTNTTKWLGLHFDEKLSWQKHINETKLKGMKAMNIMRMLSNRNWGIRRNVLLKLYHAFVLPILDYGCIVYGSANPAALSKLNVVQNTALRLVSGALRTSPIPSLLAECGQAPLDVRRNILTINYACRVASNPLNPMYLVLTSRNLRTRPIDVNVERPPLPFRTRVYNIEHVSMRVLKSVFPFSDTPPPWCLQSPKIFFLTDKPKQDLIEQEVKILHNEFKEKYGNTFYCYTDGSKSQDNTGGAFLFNGQIQQFRLPPQSSIYTAELVAILKCLEKILKTIEETCIIQNFFVCSDSQSSLVALKNIYTPSAVVKAILAKLMDIRSNGHRVHFLWIPSHCGIRENDIVDIAAKTSTQARLEHIVTCEDIKNFLKLNQLRKWSNTWKDVLVTNNKLRLIKPDTKVWKTSNSVNRRNEIVLCRLRIGHILATHKHLFERKDPPSCEFCGITPFTVKHLLVDCRKLLPIRRKHNLSSDMEIILSDDILHVDNCLAFLRSINFLNKI